MRVRIALLIGVLVTTGAACRGNNESDAAADTGPIAVTTAPARLDTLRDVLLAPGTVVPSAIADFIVTAPEPAEIAELSKNEGDIVKAGDVLVRLEIPSVTNEIATRQLEMIEATSRFDRAKADFERQSKLFEQGIASRNAWDTARLALSSAEANLSGVRARFDAAKALGNNTIIRARFTGVVAKRFKVQGESVLGGELDPIMRIIDPTRLQVLSQVPIADSTRILPGQTGQVTAGAGLEPVVVALKVPPLNPTITTVDIRFNFIAPTTLPVDSPVQVEIAVEERKDVIVVPASAVLRVEGGAFVWVANTNNQATRKDVGVGMTNGKLTQITSGLAVGDAVIVTGLAQLQEGVAIVVTR